MNPEAILEQAARGKLYPSVILYGADADARRTLALDMARTLLCENEEPERPCGECTHCRRVLWPGTSDTFHPDLHVLERDLRASTSIDATRKFLKPAHSAPFEARGQVFIVAEAETLSAAAGDTLLKLLEEPPVRTPRHFLLLAVSHLDLLPTLRSRSLTIYMGSRERLDPEEVGRLAEQLAPMLEQWFQNGSAALLLGAASLLVNAADWKDLRARRPWSLAAAALLEASRRAALTAEDRRLCLKLAEALMDGWRLRLRAISAPRILEGLIAQHLVR